MRNYYTFEEIIVGLRKEYQENQMILNELIKYIDINSNLDVSKKVWLNLKNYNYDSLANVYIKILKKQNEIENLYYHIHDKIFLKNDFRDSVLFKMMEKENQISFEKTGKMGSKIYTNAKISINNQDKFDEVYEKLKNTKLYQLERWFECLNFYQTLLINGDGICLSNRENINNLGQSSFFIKYQSDTDLVNIHSKHRHNNYTINSMLYTKINVNDLPYNYLEILEKNESEIQKFSQLYISDATIKNDSYEIEEKSLVKTKKL